MANKTAIVQAALARLGEEVPSSLAEDTDPLIAVNAIYDSITQEFLTAHAWSFATRWRVLERTVTEPEKPWTYVYEPPAGCLNIRDILDEVGAPTNYELAENVIYSNQPGPVTIIYTWSPTEERWPGDFAGAVEEELLGRLLEAFEERARGLQHRDVAKGKLEIAAKRDRRQNPPQRRSVPPLLRAWFNRAPRRL